MTQSQIIYSVLQNAKGWTPSWKLEKSDTPYGWIGTSGLRRCREMVESGQIECREGKDLDLDKRFVYYRYKSMKQWETLLAEDSKQGSLL